MFCLCACAADILGVLLVLARKMARGAVCASDICLHMMDVYVVMFYMGIRSGVFYGVLTVRIVYML